MKIKSFPLRILLSSVIFYNVAVAEADSVSCQQGYGSDKVMVIDPSRINDGYCDCPVTGEDEPETQACAGNEFWPGNVHKSLGESDDSVGVFTCPQQPDMKIPSSRVNDGICDCCDGADEGGVGCEDNCAEILEAQRKAREALQSAYSKGSKLRREWLENFKNIRAETLSKIKDSRQQLETLESDKVSFTELYEQEQILLMDNRAKETHHLMRQLVHSEMPLGSLFSLKMDELVQFIVYACQLAGEMESNTKLTTCAPLRLAALDIGMTWEADTYKWTRVESKALRAALVDYNVENDSPIWSKGQLETKLKHKSHLSHRRLDEDDFDYDDEDYDHDYMGDDYYPYEDDEETDAEHSSHTNAYSSEDSDSDVKGDKRQELLQVVRSSNFYKNRMAFLEQADKLLERIKELQDAENKKKEEEKNSEEGEGDEATTETEEKTETDDDVARDFDPMALPMVRNKLEDRKKTIEHGFDYAVSAHVLLEGRNETSLDVVVHLATGILTHAPITTLQYYEILAHVIPELHEEIADNSEETCVSPWASLCPPKVDVQRQEQAVLTSGVLLKALEFCSAHTGPSPDTCQAQAAASVPSSIPDGYYGYYEPHARDEFDPLSIVCEPATLKEVEGSRTSLLELEQKLENVSKDKKRIEKEVSDMESNIGGVDEPVLSLGVSGELYSLQQECFSTEAGKYIYEICLFGKAAQKEKSGGSTSLGNWVEATLDDEGKRIWKWDKGVKCWNGPERSMKAFVTCGAETKVISAEEPDTCQYEVQVESPVACDDVYRLENGLEREK